MSANGRNPASRICVINIDIRGVRGVSQSTCHALLAAAHARFCPPTVPHSFISRVRKETVLQEAGAEKLSIILGADSCYFWGASHNFHGRTSCEHIFSMMGRCSRDSIRDFGSGVDPNKPGFPNFFAWLWICAAIGLV